MRDYHANFDALVNGLAVGSFGLAVLILSLLGLLVHLQRSKAGKIHALGKAWVLLLLLWVGGLLAAVVTALDMRYGKPLLAVLIGASAGTVLLLVTRKLLRRRIQSYRLACPTCHLSMEMLSEQEDDAKLTPEEVAEEKAGGMDYEFWTCGKCAHLERFEVKLHKAAKCSKCLRRTLERPCVVVSAASTASSGTEKHSETCHNPKCNYQRSWIHVIPRHSTSNVSYHSSSTFRSSSSSSRSSSSSSSSSSRSSFGGGRSSGGGASRGW